MARNISTVCNGANSGVNRLKFISLAAVPYILPDTRDKFMSCKFHICNRQ